MIQETAQTVVDYASALADLKLTQQIILGFDALLILAGAALAVYEKEHEVYTAVPAGLAFCGFVGLMTGAIMLKMLNSYILS